MSPFVPLQPNSFPLLNSNTMAQALPHAIMYTAGQQQVHYLPQYYSTPYAQYAPSSYPERTLKAERRRPKYTRSKTGCLTCRKKKVKCDETKPACQRCSNSQLTCTWPEIPPPKKKAPSRKGRSPADQGYSTSTSEAGTSSLSPTDENDMDGTPQPSFKSEAPSPEIGREGASATPALAFADPNMLQVEAGLSSDRRHSEPHLMPLAPSAIETRRRSMADIMDGQHYAHHNSHQQNQHQHQHQQHSHNHVVSTGNGALGLSLNQLAHGGAGLGTRPSTPNEFLYPQVHTHVHRVQHAPPPSSGFAAYTSTGNVTIIPNISSGSTSSRPSTAASSLSLSHSLHQTSAGSRPSTAGSHVGAGAGAQMTGHQYMHRPASSGGGSGAADYSSLGFSPFSFQLGRNPGDVSFDAANAMGGYASACISRPSTANSAPSASVSPYMRHGAMPMDGSGGMGVERWHASPLLGQAPLAQPQPHAVDGSGIGGYFQQMMHSPPQHSRTHSPAWAC